MRCIPDAKATASWLIPALIRARWRFSAKSSSASVMSGSCDGRLPIVQSRSHKGNRHNSTSPIPDGFLMRYPAAACRVAMEKQTSELAGPDEIRGKAGAMEREKTRGKFFGVRSWQAKLSLAVLCCLLALVAQSPASSRASSLSWSAPQLIDGGPGAETSSTGNPSSVSCPSASLCVEVDEEGRILTSSNPTNGEWSNPVSSGGYFLAAVSCPTTSFCAIAEPNGRLITSTDPTGGAQAWSTTDIDGNADLRDVSCTSASFCAAVDWAGNVLTSTNPTGDAAAWSSALIDNDPEAHGLASITCQSATFCVATDFNNNIITSTNPTGGAGSWTLANLGANPSNEFVWEVSCPSASLCVGTHSGDGDIITSTNPTGGAGSWTHTHIASSNSLRAVSCASTALCVATDEKGNIYPATTPTGGAGAWSSAHVDASPGNKLATISCPSTGLCVAFDFRGNLVYSTNPTGGAAVWIEVESVDAYNELITASCSSSSQCVALDAYYFNALSSSNPTGGPSAWSTSRHWYDFYNTAFPTGIDCPSATLCVEVAESGQVMTTGEPTGPASSWSAATVDGGRYLTSVSCPTAALCVAADSEGNIVTSTNPDGGAGSWSVANVDGTNPIYAVSCPTVSFCVAVGGEGFSGDEEGHVLTSTNPTAGAGAWAVSDLGPFEELVDVSCATASLCVGIEAGAFGDVGRVRTSTQPGLGASSWSSPFQITPGTDHLEDVSCASAPLCVAVDSSGDAIASTDPAAGASAWSAQQIDSQQLSTIDCLTAHFCLAADFHGNVLTASGSGLLNEYNLSVQKSGSGSGIVTSGPAGINCGATCQAKFTEGTPVTLTAAPAPGSSFAGWSGGGCTGTGTCEVTLTTDTNVMATFGLESPSGEGESPGGGSPGEGGSAGGGSPSAAGPTTPPSTGSHGSGGEATTGEVAAVTGGTVALNVKCPMGGTCSGLLKLIAQVSSGPVTKRHGKRHPFRNARRGKHKGGVVIGKHAFSVAGGHSATVKVSLNAKGKAMLRHAGKRGLVVRLTGTGIKSRTIHLKPNRYAPGRK